MEHLEQEEMKISPATVRRLRTARGWSQEQLAVVSGLSLRTIQRVEADGSASRETRTSLAATFSIQLADLAGAPTAAEQLPAIALFPTMARYKIAAIIAGVTFIPAVFGVAGVLPASIAWLAAASSMVTVALLLYSGLGWYLAGGTFSQSPTRRIAQTLFIFAAIFCGFASANRGSASNVAIAAQIGLISVLIYFALDFVLSRNRNSSKSR